MTKETQDYFYSVSVTLIEDYCSVFHDLDSAGWASEKHKRYEQVGGLWQSCLLILLSWDTWLSRGNLPGERACVPHTFIFLPVSGLLVAPQSKYFAFAVFLQNSTGHITPLWVLESLEPSLKPAFSRTVRLYHMHFEF